METMGLSTSKVTKTDGDVIFHITHGLHGNISEPNNQFKEFIQGLMKTISSIALITP
jgi:hypothetical protein